MQATHHPLQWMRHETVTAAHWCSVHMLHDRNFWIYLAIALTLIALIILMVRAGGGTVLDHELRYYAYPYMPVITG